MSKYGEPEIYSRFLRKDWLKANNSRIHFKAFVPIANKNTNRLEVSCFETQDLNNKEIMILSDVNYILLNNKPPIGFCSITKNKFPFDKISIDRNYIPERHIDLIGWKNYQSKEDINEIASILAEKSSDDIVVNNAE